MPGLRGMPGEIAAAAGFLARLGHFLRAPVSADEARRRLQAALGSRSQAFVRLMERAVFGFPASPYLRLLQSARISLEDVERMVAQAGVEGALQRMHDAGVFITLEEFKGITPLRRPGLELAIEPEHFDNPLSARDYEANTGGSGGRARRILFGLDLLEHEACYHAGFYEAFGATTWPAALWLPAPPGAVGIKSVLIRAKLGASVARWFSQVKPDEVHVRHRGFASATRTVAAMSGWKFPRPEYTPAADADRVAGWLAGQRERAGGAVCLTTPSAAVRTCGVAIERGLDIRGTLFVLVGEPFTEAKAGVIAAAGCRAASHYAMVEAGMIGLACHAPAAPDDVHLVSDKVATIQVSRDGNNGTSRPLLHTSLLAAAPKVMLNVESGDAGVIEERDCGCGVLPSSWRRHLHTIRSYEKLTSEGMHFVGTRLITLVEEVLVRRYGGRPTDWQFIEQEEAGVPRVSLIASPVIGALDDRDVVRTALEYLGERGIGERLMAEVWENGGTLRVVRAEPHVTAAGKIQPLQKL